VIAVVLAFASGALITALATDLFATLLETSGAGALALLAAIFASNLPEALGGAVGMRGQGRTRLFAISVWTAIAVVLALSVVAGNAVLSGARPETLSVLLAFAGGAVLASLADILMPDAYREGGPYAAFATAAGFFASFLLAQLQRSACRLSGFDASRAAHGPLLLPGPLPLAHRSPLNAPC